MDVPGKMFQLGKIMHSVHELAALAWPNGMPQEALDHVLDIQQHACKALGLPEDTALTAGNGID